MPLILKKTKTTTKSQMITHLCNDKKIDKDLSVGVLQRVHSHITRKGNVLVRRKVNATQFENQGEYPVVKLRVKLRFCCLN